MWIKLSDHRREMYNLSGMWLVKVFYMMPILLYSIIKDKNISYSKFEYIIGYIFLFLFFIGIPIIIFILDLLGCFK